MEITIIQAILVFVVAFIMGIDPVSYTHLTGIIAKISETLYQHQVNIVDISQNVMEDMFAMVMLVNIDKCTVDFTQLADLLDQDGEALGMKIHTMHEDIFDAMHKI